jgi:hypothetical protein
VRHARRLPRLPAKMIDACLPLQASVRRRQRESSMRSSASTCARARIRGSASGRGRAATSAARMRANQRSSSSPVAKDARSSLSKAVARWRNVGAFRRVGSDGCSVARIPAGTYVLSQSPLIVHAIGPYRFALQVHQFGARTLREKSHAAVSSTLECRLISASIAAYYIKAGAIDSSAPGYDKIGIKPGTVPTLFVSGPDQIDASVNARPAAPALRQRSRTPAVPTRRTPETPPPAYSPARARRTHRNRRDT